jgi:hypothetical protein
MEQQDGRSGPSERLRPELHELLDAVEAEVLAVASKSSENELHSSA